MIRIDLDHSTARVSRIIPVERRAKSWRGWLHRMETIDEQQLLGVYQLSSSSRVNVQTECPGRLDVLLQGHSLSVRFRTEDQVTPVLNDLSNRMWFMLGPRISRWTMFKMRVRSYFLNRMGR